jgi:putative hydrolase of the HAD superfamily
MIRAVIFDWFNTLAHYEPPREEVHSRVLREFNINVEPARLISPLLKADKFFYDENVKSPIRKRSKEDQVDFYVHYEEILLEEAGVSYDKRTLQQVYQKGDLLFSQISEFALFDDVLPVLQSLRERKLMLGLLTNYAKDMTSLCRKLGMEAYIDFIVTPFETHADKPEPAIFRAALNKAGAKAEEAIYVGDQYASDVVGARSVNMQPVLIDRYNLYPDITDCPRITALTQIYQFLI